MKAITKPKPSMLRHLVVSCQHRSMSYDMRELTKMNAEFQRKINVLKMFTEQKQFNYEAPEMTYDKKTGNVTIIDPEDRKRNTKKIIKNYSEVEGRRQQLYAELGLDSDGTPKEGVDPSTVNAEELGEKLYNLRTKENEDEELDFDPTMFHMFTRDFMRVDVGLMIQRPPIFLHMRERDKDFMVARQSLMEEYFCDTKQFIDEFNEVSKLNEDVLATNPYVSRMNLDNYPSHRMKDELTGEYKTYCAASKNWAFADPQCTDSKSLHYAGEDRVYLLLQNKYTDEWEFPVTSVHVGQTFFRAKMSIFEELTGNQWKIKFTGSSPVLHTLREFTPAEQDDSRNHTLKGVRTFWFPALHLRGLPDMLINQATEGQAALYKDWAWVPKRKLNEYFARDYYDIFSKVSRTR